MGNDTVYGLVSYVFTESLRRGVRYAEALETGMVVLNQGRLREAFALTERAEAEAEIADDLTTTVEVAALSARTVFVASLASATLGWSNGLISNTQPITATANSLRKKRFPRSVGPWTARVITGCPAWASAWA